MKYLLLLLSFSAFAQPQTPVPVWISSPNLVNVAVTNAMYNFGPGLSVSLGTNISVAYPTSVTNITFDANVSMVGNKNFTTTGDIFAGKFHFTSTEGVMDVEGYKVISSHLSSQEPDLAAKGLTNFGRSVWIGEDMYFDAIRFGVGESQDLNVFYANTYDTNWFYNNTTFRSNIVSKTGSFYGNGSGLTNLPARASWDYIATTNFPVLGIFTNTRSTRVFFQCSIRLETDGFGGRGNIRWNLEERGTTNYIYCSIPHNVSEASDMYIPFSTFIEPGGKLTITDIDGSGNFTVQTQMYRWD